MAPTSPTLPDDLLAQRPEEAVRRIALARLEELEGAALRLGDPNDAEAVHDLRVALRRLRSTLRAWKVRLAGSVRPRHRRALSELQALTGGGRDAEVGARGLADMSGVLSPAERRGALWLRGRLVKQAARERQSMRRAAEKSLPRLLRRLKRCLSSYAVQVGAGEVGAVAHETPPRFAADLALALRAHGENLRRSLARLSGGEDAAAAHAARIEGKRLRYLLEPLAERLPEAPALLERLKGLQDDFGAIQDLVALEGIVARGLEEAAVEHARKLHRAAGRASRKAGAAPRAPRDETRAGLLALSRQCAQERRRRLDAACLGWRREGPACESLVAAVEELARAAQAEAGAGLEIERKYLLRSLPPLPAAEVHEIEQGWLPGERLVERLRRVTVRGEARCWRTVKLGRGLTRVEVEEECSPDLFEKLWPLTAGRRVTKRRHVVAEGARAWEIDEFLDRDLVLAEIELADADETGVVPGWLAPFVVREVTDEDAYVNRRLAR
jgi:CHAD domain-containing protein/CYTH domain-containing protein